ncbi:S8 family serine peptidase [Streptomyces sp. NBC_00193]|uniref:S8 family serine peptidase n=1 Tax=Streptomyces sp. NBC_00193 TaxID=2975675 RepID=UPI00225A4713|nr:S8 family serine peptidase [Streptomyces sp. NBC_00193]MCX5301305.1 S8 family serine peptidase [Streptomyces sp. NBC_00193]
MDLNGAPWRRERRPHASGMPAWSMPAGGDPGETLPTALFEGIGPRWAWEGADGEGVRVCVLDSGVQAGHPLVGTVERAWQVVSAEGRAPRVEECEPLDSAGHGTACAGIIRSIAPRVSLSSLKVLGDGRAGSASALIAGLAFAIEEGFDVISMSLSTTRVEFRDRLGELCDRAYFRRTAVVAAAHNLPIESFPWNFASVISVASHAEPDGMRFYYNAAPPVEFRARGVRVPVASLGGGTVRNTGNSFAAPHMAGIAALVLSKHPWLTPFQLKSVLYHCAANVSIPDVPVRGEGGGEE